MPHWHQEPKETNKSYINLVFYTIIQISSARYKTARHASLDIEHCMKITDQEIVTIFWLMVNILTREEFKIKSGGLMKLHERKIEIQKLNLSRKEKI